MRMFIYSTTCVLLIIVFSDALASAADLETTLIRHNKLGSMPIEGKDHSAFKILNSNHTHIFKGVPSPRDFQPHLEKSHSSCFSSNSNFSAVCEKNAFQFYF